MAQIRMLKSFKGYAEDSLQDFGSTENARLVSIGFASNDLDGPDGEAVQDRANLAAELAAIGVVPNNDSAPASSFSSTVYLFCHPTTQSNNYSVGERQVYVPTSRANVFFGLQFGKKFRTHTAECVTDVGLHMAGLHTWHGSLTKTGTWANAPANQAAGAFQATGGAYSVTAGDQISGVVIGTAAAIRTFMAGNGGCFIVSIDGDWTRANKLPTFTDADYSAGRCRAADVGKRFFSTYGVLLSECICLSTDLSPGSHTITVEVTGTKDASSSDVRAYVEGFVGCNGQTLGATNVYPVPIQWLYHHYDGWSALDYVPKWAPSGSSDYQFLGSIHGNNTESKEVTTSLVIYVDTVDQTALAAGSWATGQTVRIEHVSTLAHKANTSTVVGTKTRLYTFAPSRKYAWMLDTQMVWSAAGSISVEYPAALPVGEPISYSRGMNNPSFTTYTAGHVSAYIPQNNNDSIIYHAISVPRIGVSSPAGKFIAEVLGETPFRGMLYGSSGAAMSDRASEDKKLYVQSVLGAQSFASGYTFRYVAGWGVTF